MDVFSSLANCRARAASVILMWRRERPGDAAVLLAALAADARALGGELRSRGDAAADPAALAAVGQAVARIEALANDPSPPVKAPLILRRAIAGLEHAAALLDPGHAARLKSGRRRTFLGLAAGICLILGLALVSRPGQDQSLADLGLIQEALGRYRADHGAYPVSTAFDGLYSQFGESKPDWIPGLVPAYLPALPRDRRGGDDRDRQYLYMSDGRDYKLITFHPPDREAMTKARPDLFDAPSAPYYGVWTKGAAAWKPTAYDPKAFDRALFDRRLADLERLRLALARYHNDHGAYPPSQGLDGFLTRSGRSGPDWIAGLVPDYLPELPRDPAGGDDPGRQYYYASNGVDYKLIAHNPGGCQQVFALRPELIDPARHCWAYGFWTPGAAQW